MIRKEAIRVITNETGDSLIVSANGYISRDLFEINDKPSNFYMIGSMGLASSIAVGISLKKPRKRIFIFDGDGNILMNLGSLVTIGALNLKNIVHVVFDNSSHESTGGQPSPTKKIDLSQIAKSVNFTCFRVNNKKQLLYALTKIKSKSGPIFLHVKIKNSKRLSKRVSLRPIEIRDRVMNSLV